LRGWNNTEKEHEAGGTTRYMRKVGQRRAWRGWDFPELRDGCKGKGEERVDGESKEERGSLHSGEGEVFNAAGGGGAERFHGAQKRDEGSQNEKGVKERKSTE